MPAYLVSLPSGSSHGNKNSDVVVFAEDATYARSLAKAAFNVGSNLLWDEATVTEIVAGADFQDWTLRVRVVGAAGQNSIIDMSVVGAASDTIDLIGAAMVTALNNHADIAGAAYDGGNLLTIASGAGGDDLGDGTVTVEFIPPGENRGSADAYIGTVTHQGATTAVLSAQLATDAIAVGNIVGELPRRV